ncbi:MAG: DUF4185 domain-containing protein [Ginsengibacter sp.]
MKTPTQLIVKESKIFTIILLLGISSCLKPIQVEKEAFIDKTDSKSISFIVEEAPDWTNLFKRTSGWLGGDGIYAIPQSGIDSDTAKGETTILFSDSMFGDIKNGKLKPGATLINNSVGILTGGEPRPDKIKFYSDKLPNGSPKSLFIPSSPNTKPGEYFWLGDGFVNHELNDNTYIFGYRMTNSGGNFGFATAGTTFIILPKGSKPPYKNQRQLDNPFFIYNTEEVESTIFGSAIFDNSKKAGVTNGDGYVYVYGIRGFAKNLVVARVLPVDFENFSKWRFWNGSQWQSNIYVVANVTNHLSNELSVSRLPDGRYIVFFQVDGISSKIGARIGKTPVGPFGPILNVYDCKNALENVSGIFAYNAKAHPSLSKPNEILVSYNVNSFDFLTVITNNPNLYRPRFITIKMVP